MDYIIFIGLIIYTNNFIILEVNTLIFILIYKYNIETNLNKKKINLIFINN